jgi:hypothetical protein
VPTHHDDWQAAQPRLQLRAAGPLQPRRLHSVHCQAAALRASLRLRVWSRNPLPNSVRRPDSTRDSVNQQPRSARVSETATQPARPGRAARAGCRTRPGRPALQAARHSGCRAGTTRQGIRLWPSGMISHRSSVSTRGRGPAWPGVLFLGNFPLPGHAGSGDSSSGPAAARAGDAGPTPGSGPQGLSFGGLGPCRADPGPQGPGPGAPGSRAVF